MFVCHYDESFPLGRTMRGCLSLRRKDIELVNALLARQSGALFFIRWGLFWLGTDRIAPVVLAAGLGVSPILAIGETSPRTLFGMDESSISCFGSHGHTLGRGLTARHYFQLGREPLLFSSLMTAYNGVGVSSDPI